MSGQPPLSGVAYKVLTGAADDERILLRGHDQLSVFGIVSAEEARLLRPLVRSLQARGTLVSTEHGGLALAGDARAILKGDESVCIALPPAKERRRPRDKAAANPLGDPLFEALRALRRDLAKEAGVPPYVIFHDATLREIATLRPTGLASLGGVSGVGERKLAAYGEAFLRVVREHL